MTRKPELWPEPEEVAARFTRMMQDEHKVRASPTQDTYGDIEDER